MKILYHHRIRSRDGQAVHLEELIAALRSLGHDVLLVGPDAFARASFGHEPKLLGLLKKFAPNMMYELLELGYNVAALLRLFRACRKFRPDFIYERYNLYLLAGIWGGRIYGVPLLLEVNAPLARERTSFGGLGFPRLARYLERFVWQAADCVLAVSRALANEIHAAGVPSDRIAVTANAIDPAQFALGADCGSTKKELRLSDKLVLGFAGFVRDWHGLDSIISLLARPDTPANLHLLLVGDGPAIPGLKSQAQTLGVADRVAFSGLVERDRIAYYLTAFDIAVLPMCVDYCSPLKLFEYMVAGKAIVAPDQANIREILEDGISCLLFEPNSPESLTSALLRLANDDQLRVRLGRAARALIVARGYTWEHNARRVSAIGAGIIGARRRQVLHAAQ